MTTRISKLWDTLRSSLWFVPSLMAGAALVLALLLAALDRGLDSTPDSRLWFLYAGGADGARAVLSAIATSMITVAGVTFSVTIVALTLASQQYGPRLLGSFLRDLGNQLVLGTFIATFLYCLLVLRAIHGGDDGGFVPQLSVTAGVVLALASLGILIYFIHHVATSIQASHVISTVGADLAAAVDRMFPERIGTGDDDETRVEPPRESRPVAARQTGYVQAVDGEEIMALATRCDLVVELCCHPGDFVTDGTPIARVSPPTRADEAVERALQDAILVGRGRTVFQDLEFAIDQLVEVALRALSPGMNDPFTAMSCIDHLGAGLRRLATRRIPSRFRYQGGRLRVVAPRHDLAQAIARAFDQIRESGRDKTAVMIHLLETLRAVGSALTGARERTEVLRQATMVQRTSGAALAEEHDRTALDERYRALVAALGGPDAARRADSACAG